MTYNNSSMEGVELAVSLIQIDYASRALKRMVQIKAIIPNDVLGLEERKTQPVYKRPMKALYLLHGYMGNCNEWLLYSNIAELSLKYNIAVFMPSGENSFYLNNEATEAYYSDFIGEELVAYTRALFGLSIKKEDTIIAGLSMGGFGAIYNGFRFPNHFGKIIALSSALIIHDIKDKDETFHNGVASYSYYHHTFGDLGEVVKSDKNPEIILEKSIMEGNVMPALYMACGTSDFLIEQNRSFHKFVQSHDIEHTYVEGEGVHDWRFWNQYIEPGLLWAF